MRKYHYIKINLPGGIVAAGDLHAWMEAAERCGVDQVQFGNRQHLFCRADSSSEKEFRTALDHIRKSQCHFMTDCVNNLCLHDG